MTGSGVPELSQGFFTTKTAPSKITSGQIFGKITLENKISQEHKFSIIDMVTILIFVVSGFTVRDQDPVVIFNL